MCKYCQLIDHKKLVFIPHNNVNFKILEKTFFGFLNFGLTAFRLFIFFNFKGNFTTLFKSDCFMPESIKVVKVFKEIDLRIINLLIGNIFWCKC